MIKYVFIKWTVIILIIYVFNDLSAQINYVVENNDPVKLFEKFELTINLTANYSNPFNPEDIDLWASFASPSNVQWNRINGFWDGTEWKIRFAGNEIGIWNYIVHFDDGSVQFSSSNMTFEIIKSEHHGWIRIADFNPHYLEYSDGTSFYGTGQCRAWNLTDVPNIFNEMKSHKMNILHYWMPSWDNILVTDQTGYDQYEMDHAANIDDIINSCESNGITLMLTIWNHHELRGEGHPWDRHFFDEYNPFRHLTTLSEFFADSTSWSFQKKLYRYIIARWGYSQAIGIWQTICEIDGTTNSWNNDLITDPWYEMINDYFKENDPFHHITSASKSNDAWLWPNGFSIMDVLQIHTFSDELNITSTDIVSDITDRTKTVWNSYDKPVFIGEFAADDNAQQSNQLHNGIWSGLTSGGAIIPLEWNDGDLWGDFTDEMYDHVFLLSKFVEPLQLNKRNLSQADLNISSEFNAYGLLGEIGIVWIQDKSPGEINSGEILSLNTQKEGKYAIDWYNTWNGDFYSEKVISSTSNNIINVTIHDFTNDIAARITYIGELNEETNYFEEISSQENTPFRWKDIENNIYDINYQNNFRYSQSRVTVSFQPTSTGFMGKIIGYDLKPNFAYQIKLVGKPEKEWGSEGDDISNELVGFEGRWWRKQPNPGNSDDDDYLVHKDDPNYIFEGYLLFDYLVTDEYGYVEKEFEANNSFHVLWNNVINTRLPGPNDSPMSFHNVYASTQNNIYTNAFSPDSVGLYGEWEPGRDLPGEALLPQGEYNVRLVLTEESFHQSGLGGNWVTVLGCDEIKFNIISTDSGFLDCKIFLEGPYSIITDTMLTALNTTGLLPLNQPFANPPLNYEGNESVTAIPNDVVDWILVELRDKDDKTLVKAVRAAFILKNGKIVDMDGSNPIRFNISQDDYYIVIRSRNHISVMSKDPVTIK